MSEVETLGTSLPKEIARVRDLLPLYDSLPNGAGALAATIMRQTLDRASQAMIEGDLPMMIACYRELSGFET